MCKKTKWVGDASWVLKNKETGEYICTSETEEGAGSGLGGVYMTFLHISTTVNINEAKIWDSLLSARRFSSQHQKEDFTTFGSTKGFSPVRITIQEEG